MKNTKLQARITGRNKVNSEVNRLTPLIQEAMKPFLGKKILLSNGRPTAKVEAIISQVLKTDLQTYFIHSGYFFTYGIRAVENSFNDGHNGCFYAEGVIYIGRLEYGVLKEFYIENPTRRTDYTEKEILDARIEVGKLKELLESAQSNLVGFDEYD